MEEPKEPKKLWKNIDWKDKDEKQAFFDKYFKKSEMVSDHMAVTIKGIKERLSDFIKYGKIKAGDKERPITMKDVINEINKI